MIFVNQCKKQFEDNSSKGILGLRYFFFPLAIHCTNSHTLFLLQEKWHQKLKMSLKAQENHAQTESLEFILSINYNM